jgi:hypothetical protein
MNKKCNKEQLLLLLDDLAPSKSDSLTAAAFEVALAAFCARCPDPVRARGLLLDCLDPLSDEEVVDRALAMPVPKKAEVPVRAYTPKPLAMPAFAQA